MAQRRMFNKSITNSSVFLRMPVSSRLLYYDLGMNADDDGFVEHFMVLRMTGASQQDLGVLELNGLIKIFDDNVLFIKDWKENNYIQKDRYTASKYLSIYNLDTLCIQTGDTGKDRLELDKISIDNKKEKPKKHEYGEYKNVLLTDEELDKLKNKYSNYEELIKKLDEGIELKGYKYKNHYLAIIQWDNKDKNKQIKDNKPVWFNKNIEASITSEEEKKELEELLKEFN